jgi:hypothetical protein
MIPLVRGTIDDSITITVKYAWEKGYKASPIIKESSSCLLPSGKGNNRWWMIIISSSNCLAKCGGDVFIQY